MADDDSPDPLHEAAQAPRNATHLTNAVKQSKDADGDPLRRTPARSNRTYFTEGESDVLRVAGWQGWREHGSAYVRVRDCRRWDAPSTMARAACCKWRSGSRREARSDDFKPLVDEDERQPGWRVGLGRVWLKPWPWPSWRAAWSVCLA